MPNPRVVNGLEELRALTGQEVGASSWLTVTQEMIDRFADLTGDHQWIHVDVERAKRESQFGTTIAHGFLTVSLLPQLSREAMDVRGEKKGSRRRMSPMPSQTAVAPGSRSMSWLTGWALYRCLPSIGSGWWTPAAASKTFGL